MEQDAFTLSRNDDKYLRIIWRYSIPDSRYQNCVILAEKFICSIKYLHPRVKEWREVYKIF